MTDTNGVYRRILRRETHAPRTLPAVIAALIVLLVSIAAAAGAVWWLVDPGFRDTADAALQDAAAWAAQPTALAGIGAGAVVLAVLAIALAVLPGRRARRARTTGRLALLVDDGVLADAIADAVALREGLDRRQVAVRLAPRAARVRVTPTSGVAVDEARVARAAEAALAEVGFSAAARVTLAPQGVIA
ncbi:hypothetical protein [Streptomyces sp. AC495_CC817]|uniref:hypothetical protein n=1 Tax=Streptomyces sp. AC495_CC817 TaxID=2823900 RepID=UPI001C25BB72|nr:hypothetical protein [Streptomyces sp. AC495_CC817]